MAAADAAREVSPALAVEAPTIGAGEGICSGWLPAFVRGRGRRVCLLTAAIILASIADLVLTLTLLLNWGLSEGNPLARAVMSYQSPGMVVAWRLLTLALGVMILVRLRKRPTDLVHQVDNPSGWQGAAQIDQLADVVPR